MKINRSRDRQIDEDKETFTSMGARKYVMILFIKDEILTLEESPQLIGTPKPLQKKRQRKIQE